MTLWFRRFELYPHLAFFLVNSDIIGRFSADYVRQRKGKKVR